MNRITVSVVVFLGAIIFGMVFWRQVSINVDRLADSFVNDQYGAYSAVAGAAVVRIPAKSDSTVQLDREVNSLNIGVSEEETKQLEAQIEALE